MDRITHSISSFFVKYGGALEEDRDIYEYGLTIVLSTLVNLFITLLIGALLKMPYQLIVYLIPFILLRSLAGGYHAKTFWGCVIASSFILLIVISLVLYTNPAYYLLLTIWFNVISLITVLLLAPVTNSEKKVDRKCSIRQRGRSLLLVAISCMVGIVFYLINKPIYMLCISIGVLVASLTLLPVILTRPHQE